MSCLPLTPGHCHTAAQSRYRERWRHYAGRTDPDPRWPRNSLPRRRVVSRACESDACSAFRRGNVRDRVLVSCASSCSIDDDTRECRRWPGRPSACLFSRSGDVPLDKPRGRQTFGLTPEFAAASKALAANQGLYNGFLAAGLYGPCPRCQRRLNQDFLSRLHYSRRIFGAVTANRKILWVQAVPGAVALALVLFS